MRSTLRSPFGRSKLVVLFSLLLLGALPRMLRAQRERGPQTLDAPSAEAGRDGSLRGTVLDSTGAVVPGAHVTLAGPGGEREALTGSDGSFLFAGLPGGKFRVTITSNGLGAYVSPETTLAAGETREIPEIVLPIAPANVDVRVVATQQELATEQVQAAEQQRLFGVLPNFYSSYVWDAAPLTAKLKFQLALRSATDPVTFVASGFMAGAQQAANTFPGYGQGAAGYARRFGAAYGDDVISRMLGSAVLPSVLRQDPRYFYKGSGTKRSRVLYALAAAVVCKGDNGHWQPDYSYLGGSLAAGGIANLYHPDRNRGLSLTFRNFGIDTGGHALDNLMREFVFRRLTKKVPPYAQGKP
jgi:hypothetical protein